MTDTELKELLDQHLGEHYRSGVGQLLYSGIETLRPGKYYIVGLNPRPDNSNRVLSKIPLGLRGWSAYTCQCWYQGHTHHKKHSAFLHCGDKKHNHANEDTAPCVGAGAESHQRTVFGLLRQLTEGTELALHGVFATNMYFVQTRNTAELKEKLGKDFLKFWQIHRRFLREVKPKFVICLGYGDDYSAFSLMRQRATGSPKTYESKAPDRWKDGPYIKSVPRRVLSG